ncbi:Myelin-oligodendrocyte glycoprotein Precursor [Channa argus]|uniref:Myelin-oligodendrocyte glycoprotein n=1 Tax=Channa argus TaxID=215402 RepID=A0A6G1Q789_CHAAH|nr:Myelin-oligodendrocyte glycoprotein Precursor [Channa argus]
MKMFVVVLVLLQVSHHAFCVEVYEGVESVLLPCQVNTSVSTVVWSREDYKYTTVHLRDQSGDISENQNHYYRNRTSMRADALQSGDLSLTLRKPTIRDSGKYLCTVYRSGQDLSRTEVQLLVTEPPVWPWVLAASLVLLVLLAAVGVIVYKNYRVTVTEGVESVLLPFKTTANMTEDVTVKWRLSGTNRKTVLVFGKGLNNEFKKHSSYRGRTEMKKDPLETGDLSLILKNPVCKDTGVYTCTVYRDGDILAQKILKLLVKRTALVH